MMKGRTHGFGDDFPGAQKPKIMKKSAYVQVDGKHSAATG